MDYTLRSAPTRLTDWPGNYKNTPHNRGYVDPYHEPGIEKKSRRRKPVYKYHFIHANGVEMVFSTLKEAAAFYEAHPDTVLGWVRNRKAARQEIVNAYREEG